MESEQPRLDQTWNNTDDPLNNQFISIVGNAGLSRWEKALEITPKEADSLEDRWFCILIRVNEELPYTLPRLRNIFEIFCGPGDYSADVAEGTYHLIVKTGLAIKNSLTDVEPSLNRMVPQNLTVTLLRLYSTHTELGCFTRSQLAAHIHDQLRNEVLN